MERYVTESHGTDNIALQLEVSKNVYTVCPSVLSKNHSNLQYLHASENFVFIGL